MKKFTSLLLAGLLALSFTACGGNNEPDPTTAPTAEPTAVVTEVPTEAPTEVPTEAPTPVPNYSYNEATREFSDDYVSFTLPEGYEFSLDSTEETENYDAYISFKRSVIDSYGSNVMYMVYDSGDSASYSTMTAEEINTAQLALYEAMNIEATITPINFNAVQGEGYAGICYEYDLSFNMFGIQNDVAQIIWAVNTDDGKVIEIVYSFIKDDVNVCRTSVNTIVVK